MPSGAAIFTSSGVIADIGGEGRGSPDGWLCTNLLKYKNLFISTCYSGSRVKWCRHLVAVNRANSCLSRCNPHNPSSARIRMLVHELRIGLPHFGKHGSEQELTLIDDVQTASIVNRRSALSLQSTCPSVSFAPKARECRKSG